MTFTHLHVHSHYSLLDGLAKPDELLNKTKEQGLSALALTDHGVMFGAIEFYQKAKKAGIKPIIGIEAYVAKRGMLQKRAKIDTKPDHLVLLAKNKEGYKNLLKLTTRAHLEGYYYKPRVDKELLKKYHRGLIALSACLEGEIPKEIINQNIQKAENVALQYQKIFGPDNFYLELQHHPNLPRQKIVNRNLIAISKKYGIPLVATNDVHYLNAEDDKIHDILLCIQTQKKVQDSQRLSMLGEDFSLKSPKEMIKAFRETPSAIKNTEKIAKMCNLELELGKIELPYFNVPKGYTPDSYLAELCRRGLRKRYNLDYKTLESETANAAQRKIKERLDFELSVIKKTGFASYILIVQDFVNWAKNHGIVVGPGRGSAAGSLISYLLNITDLDPIQYNLLFERFLNPERINMPDIDLDFADTRRDDVIKYIEKKYGSDHVAQIVTFGTMAARAAVRDCGRALGFSYNFCDRAAKMIPPFTSLDEALEKVYELKEFVRTDPNAKKLLDSAKKLEGVVRHVSTHACGLVITKDHIDNYTPRQHPAQDDQTIVTQYEMHSIEALGLLKIDLLGLKNLTIIQNALKIIEKTKKQKIDLQKIPLNDKKTFKLLAQGQTTGVFQLESSGVKRYLKQLAPTEFEDIIAMISLYRPGPMEWIPNFIAAKHGAKKINYLHPKLKPILEKTYGVAIYQEQVMQIARDLAGFTLAEADVLRKAVGKKIRSLLQEQRKKFIEGCIANNVSREIAEKIFSFIEPFAEYGFNRSHGSCYALIAYQTAYLKAHFPVEFMASLLTSDQENIDRVAIEIAECKQMGIEVLPPDINESFATFAVIPGTSKIRFALSAIKNVGQNVIEEIICERKRNGKFKSFDDFIRRVHSKDLNKKSLESLAKSGAFDSLAERNQILASMDKILTYSKTVQKAKLLGQRDLFSGLAESNTNTFSQLKLNKVKAATKKEKLAWEKALLGLYVSEHPVNDFKDYLACHACPCNKLSIKDRGRKVTIGGIITSIKKIVTKTSESMLFVKLEDLTGNVEVLVFPSILKQNPTLWQEDKIVLVQGKLSDKDGELKILCNQAKELTQDTIQTWQQKNSSQKLDQKVQKRTSGFLQITIPENASPALLSKLKNIFKTTSGNQNIILRIPDGLGNLTEIKTDFSVNYNADLKQKLSTLLDQKNIKWIDQ